jgi:hypothetical protein
LRGGKLAALKNKIWSGATYFTREADLAYNNDPDGQGAGSRGVCMDLT